MREVIMYRISLITLNLITGIQACNISFEPCWQPIGSPTKTNQDQTYVIIGTITCKKKSKERITLDHLELQWHGDTISFLLGSLYHNHPPKKFMAIEKYLICDSAWNNNTQQLIFNFKEKVTLQPVTSFCIVLMVPQNLEDTLRSGYFSLQKNSLPQSLQNEIADSDLRISFDAQRHQDRKKSHKLYDN